MIVPFPYPVLIMSSVARFPIETKAKNRLWVLRPPKDFVFGSGTEFATGCWESTIK